MTNAWIKQEKYFGVEPTLGYASHQENSFLAQMKLNWVLKNILEEILTVLTTRSRPLYPLERTDNCTVFRAVVR